MPEEQPRREYEPASNHGPVQENRGEQSPEQTVANAVGAIEKWDMNDPIFTLPVIRYMSRGFWETVDNIKKKNAEWAKENPKGAIATQAVIDVGRVTGVTAVKIVWGLLKFVGTLIKNKGKMDWKTGKEIGEGMMPFGKEKGEKK
jgi:hypothetical protein